MKHSLIAMITAIFTAILLTVSADAATITVNTLVDENNTNAAACSLREAITNANNDNATNGLGCVAGAGTDVINISVNGTITPTAVLPTISTSMSITGNGASSLTVSGNNAFRVFVVSGGTVSINNLTVANGFDAGQAGGIYNTSSGILTLSGVTVTASNSPQGAGFQNDSTMTVTNSIIRNNVTTNNGSGGGAANFGTLTVNGSTFLQNSTPGTSTSRFGGGIDHKNGTLTINNSTFDGNSSSVGGGLYMEANANLTNVTFINNVATFSGGGFEPRSVVNCTNCTVSGNTSQRGGGINATDIGAATNLTLLNSTVSFNKSDSTGGLRLGDSNTIVSLRNTIIAGNTNVAGTTQSDVGGSNVDAANSSFNLIGTGGAGGLVNGTNNNQVGIANTGVLPIGDYGGTVQTMPIRTNSPARNAGTNTGAPTTDARGYSRAQGSSVDIGAFEIQTNSIVINTANSGAGSLRDVVAVVPASEIVQFENPLFFTSPQTISLSAGQINIGKNLTINGTGADLLTVQNTQALGQTGRVIQFFGTGTTVVLNGMTITGGNTTGAGGGILTSGSDITLTVNGCHVTGNTSANTGAGISIASENTVTVLNSTISNNISNSTSTGGGGSGISNIGSILNVVNSTISGNTKNNGNMNGGGIWNTGTASITNSTITNNSATAGASRASGIYNTVSGTITVRNSIIAANQDNSTIPDVEGIFTSSGFNIVGNRGTATGFNQPTDKSGTGASPINPLLTPLGNFGGTTPTHAFTNRFSPAIDAGNASGETLDQRGLARTFDNPNIANVSDGTDIGAYESLTTTAAGIRIGGRVLTSTGKGLTNAIVTLTTANGTTRTTLTSFKGRFSFADVANGETLILSVKSKRYQFAEQALSANEDVNNISFIAQ